MFFVLLPFLQFGFINSTWIKGKMPLRWNEFLILAVVTACPTALLQVIGNNSFVTLDRFEWASAAMHMALYFFLTSPKIPTSSGYNRYVVCAGKPTIVICNVTLIIIHYNFVTTLWQVLKNIL